MRRVALALAVVLTAGIAVPATGADTGLDDARSRLAGAERELTELQELVRRTNDEISALDERLRTASTELAQVRDQLDRARAALAAAREEERRTAAALLDADEQLGVLLEDWEEHRARLQDRAVQAYKHGGTAPADLLIRGVAGAADWHEVAVTLETVSRMVEDDRALADGTAQSTRDTAVARAEVGAVRQAALAAARDAAREQRRVEDLVARQERLVADVATQRDDRRAVLATLEVDVEARQALVRELHRRVLQLEIAALGVFVPVNVDLDVHGPPPAWAAGLPAHGQAYGAAIEAVAARNGIDGRLLAALVWTESGFRPDAVSHAGALGLAQLMPGTAHGLGVDPRDPIQNLDGGARYLRTQLSRFGSVDLALAAYNAGPGRVEAAGDVPNIVETQLYVIRVLERYQRLAGTADG